MAWYRAGGGGIPSSLKTGMDSVLNKKFGTSTTYPAEDWPDTVNLMGPLPEKTVSGAIATFADGADAVPLKSLVANLPASLTPYEEVEITHAGKNLLNDSIRGHAGANIYFAHDTGLQTDFAVRLKAGTYTYSVVTADGTVSNLYIKNSDTNTNITGFPAYATLSKTFTLEEDTKCAVYVYKQDYTDVTDIVSAQIEVGSSASDYEPYQEPTEYDVEITNPNPNLRPSADIDEGMWTTSGTINPSSGGFGRALTMAVSEKTSYDIYGLLDDLVVYLDSNKTMLSYERLSNTSLSLQNERKTTPANCAYIGLSALAFDVSSVSIKESFLVYGGSIDVISGEGTSTHANVKVSDLTWTKQTASGRDFFISQVSDMKTGTPKDIDSVLPYGGEITVAAMADKSLASWTNSLQIYDTDITTVSELLETYGNDGISYPLATPETFTFDPVPIDSKLGNNTIWSEQGDTEVTYRADINLALGGQ